MLNISGMDRGKINRMQTTLDFPHLYLSQYI